MKKIFLLLLYVAFTGSVKLRAQEAGPVSSLPCGFVFSKMDQIVSAVPVSGAKSYKFSFYDNASGQILAKYVTASNKFNLASVPNLFYNTTYKWTVAVDVGNGYGSESDKNCLVAFGIPQTTVTCGNQYSKFNSYTMVRSPGKVSAYRFRFYDSSNGRLVAEKIQSSNYILFSTVSGLFYNTTYNWTVACEYVSAKGGRAFGPESDKNCTISFLIPKAALPCGVSYDDLKRYTTVSSPGKIANYHFTFYDDSTGAIVAQKVQSSNYLFFYTVPGLYYNTTYKWTVALEYQVRGGGTAIGPESDQNCTVTFKAPASTVPCGNTYVLSSGYTTARAIYGATAYRFTFYSSGTQVTQITQASNYIFFRQVSGLKNNQSYTWTVEVQYRTHNGLVFGAASDATCMISFGSASIISDENNQPEEDASARNAGILNNESNNPITIYPNPVTDKINFSSSEPISLINIYSVNGQLVKSFQNQDEVIVGDLDAGTYFILIQTENKMRRISFIKE